MGSDTFPRISFGIIVLNGEPFIRYCLRSIYAFAYEIIIVEGGHEDARSVCTPDGHSIDSTLDTLLSFKRDEDPENKVQLITRDGFWEKTDELGRHRTHQSRAYAEKATGDYLWQVDIDEFYKKEDIERIIGLLRRNPSITGITFPFTNFWGDLTYKIEGWKFLRGGSYCHRVFKWGPGYKYLTHEPPTIVNEQGIDLRSLNWIKGREMKKMGIFMYHYSHLFPWQVRQKVQVYRDEKPDDCADIIQWADNNYFKLTNPFNIERHYWMPSWLEYYRGTHPSEVVKMLHDIRSGETRIEMRENSDVELILNGHYYNWKVSWMKLYNIWDLYTKILLFQAGRIKNIPGKLRRLGKSFLI